MAGFPKLNAQKSSKQIIETFYGYDHNLVSKDGYFYETKNMTTEQYPLMSTRRKRSAITVHGASSFTSPQGMIEKDALVYVDNQKLYVNHQEKTMTGITLTTGEKTLVSMGAYVLIFPDKVYFNTANDSDYGKMEASLGSAPYTGSVTYEMCNSQGVAYENVTSGTTAPTNPTDGQLWNDTSNNELKKWSSSQSMWVSIETVYTKITFQQMTSLPDRFSDYDGVTITGLTYNTDLNGEKILYKVGGSSTVNDYIVVVGICGESPHTATETVQMTRTVPTMDYVCECQNRIWGCRYGNDGTQNLNEIYCCALGDFKNWHQFMGLSTDSYTASVGSDGVWTGAINYLGYPTFIKENCFHIVSVSSTGAHSISELPAPGVQKGSSKSLVVIDSTMYYKGRIGVYAYQGSFPELISSALGDETYSAAVAGAFGKRYFISMKDTSNTYQLFVYDIRKGLWIHEDQTQVTQFTKVDDELYAIIGNNLVGMNGVIGTQENDFEWSAETGLLHTSYKSGSYTYGDPERKTVTRYDIRCKLGSSTEFKMFIEYDSSGDWEYQGSVKFRGTDSILIPVRPRRCDHLRIKFIGKGEAKILSIARNLVRGSDRQ